MTTFTEKFVSVAGSGAHTGVDASNEWTLAEATANAAAAFRMNCKAGTYIADDSSSSAVMDLDVAGSINSWIEWRGYTTTIGDFVPGTAPVAVLNAGTNTLTNAIISTTITAGAFNRFIGFELTGASSHGFNGSATDNVAFVGCKIHNNGGRGVLADNSIVFLLTELTGNTTNSFDIDNTFEIIACEFHNENISTAVLSLGNSGTIAFSLFYDLANGIFVRVAGSATSFIGNTFDGDGGAASEAINSSGGSSLNGSIINNIFFDLSIGIGGAAAVNRSQRIRGFNYFSSCTTNYEDQADETTDIDDGTTDPFEDSAARDYTLASGSNAIGAGADAGNFA